jgi:hypothetical protein
MPSKMVYVCPDLFNPDAEDGSCETRISDVVEAITEATEAKLNELGLLGTDVLETEPRHGRGFFLSVEIPECAVRMRDDLLGLGHQVNPHENIRP